MAEISHACVYNLESEDFEVVKLSDFVRLPKPQTYKDFEVYNAYTIRTGKTFVDVEIIAIGDHQEMEDTVNIVAEATITHAVVEFEKDLEYQVITIRMIKEFQRFVPAYKTRFYPMKKYHATRNNKETFEDIYIHAFGDEKEMYVMIELLLKPPSHAVIRYINNNAINVMDIKDIQKGLWDFRHSKDFDEFAMYKTEASFESDEIAKDIQVLTVGELCDCNEQLQSWVSITHVLVRQIKIDKCVIVHVKQIEEFQSSPPETEDDFIPQKPYVFLDKRNHKRVAVEIYSMGSKEKIVFECLHSSKRFAKKKFTPSDIELVEGSATKKILSPSSTKRKAKGRLGKGDKLLTNRKSLIKKQSALYHKSIMRIDSGTSGSDNESATVKLTKDPNNNYESDKDNADNEDVSVLNQRLRDDVPTVQSPLHSPTGSGSNVSRRLFNDDRNINRDTFLQQSNARQRRQNPPLNNRNDHRRGMHKRPVQKRKFFANHSLESHCKVPRVRKSDEEEFYQTYWSDSSIGESDYNIFQEWTEYDSENETSTSMIHLGWDHSIPAKSWRNITKSKNASLFTKNLSRCLWKDEIVNKCIEFKDYYMKTVTDKPRTEVTPSKMKAIHQCLKYWVLVYHADWLCTETLDNILLKLEHYLGEEISYQIKEYEKARNPNKQKKKRKTWRDC